MKPFSDRGNPAARLVAPAEIRAYDVLGPRVEFFTPPAGDDRLPCTLRGTLAPGIAVPLHSHADPETYLVVSGRLEALADTAEGLVWSGLSPGDVFHVPGNARHAFRNPAREPSVMFIVSTERIARFLRAVGRPVQRSDPSSPPPSAEAIANFLAVAQRFGYWNATPEENARVGIQMSLP